MSDAAQKRFEEYIDLVNGTVDREIFSDEEIYRLELERIFARAWNFMCHESQIPKPGDFFLNYIGEESVIATRDRSGALKVFLNTCRHRGNAVCRAESGNTRAFLCTYHGWTFGLDGKLIGVPGYRELYHEDLDREKWGLISAGKVQSYKGFVFATMDPDAPDLEKFLGDVGRMGLDQIAVQGDMVVVEGIQKNMIDCNWKIAVDNVVDFYHVDISHASAVMAGFLPRVNGTDENDHGSALFGPRNHRVVMGEYGHTIGGPRITEPVRKGVEQLASTVDAASRPPELIDLFWRVDADKREALGPIGSDVFGHPNIYPNMWVAGFGSQIALRLPRGPNRTELWWFTLVERNAPEEQKAMMIARGNKLFGPAGLLEQDDGENWEKSTEATLGVIARRYPLNYQMNLGRGEVKSFGADSSYIDVHVSEHAQLWMYQSWADWMNAESWDTLQRDHSKPPTGRM